VDDLALQQSTAAIFYEPMTVAFSYRIDSHCKALGRYKDEGEESLTTWVLHVEGTFGRASDAFQVPTFGIDVDIKV